MNHLTLGLVAYHTEESARKSAWSCFFAVCFSSLASRARRLSPATRESRHLRCSRAKSRHRRTKEPRVAPLPAALASRCAVAAWVRGRRGCAVVACQGRRRGRAAVAWARGGCGAFAWESCALALRHDGRRPRGRARGPGSAAICGGARTCAALERGTSLSLAVCVWSGGFVSCACWLAGLALPPERVPELALAELAPAPEPGATRSVLLDDPSPLPVL